MAAVSRRCVNVEKKFVESHPRVCGQIEGRSIEKTEAAGRVAASLNDVSLAKRISYVEGNGNTIAYGSNGATDFFYLADDLYRGARRCCLRVLGWGSRSRQV